MTHPRSLNKQEGAKAAVSQRRVRVCDRLGGARGSPGRGRCAEGRASVGPQSACFCVLGQACWGMFEARSRNALRDTGLYCILTHRSHVAFMRQEVRPCLLPEKASHARACSLSPCLLSREGRSERAGRAPRPPHTARPRPGLGDAGTEPRSR